MPVPHSSDNVLIIAFAYTGVAFVKNWLFKLHKVQEHWAELYYSLQQRAFLFQYQYFMQ